VITLQMGLRHVADLLKRDGYEGASEIVADAESQLDAVRQHLISLLQLPIVIFEHQDEDGDTFTVDYFKAESVRTIANKALGKSSD